MFLLAMIMNSKNKCCNVISMCGLNLWQGVIFVGTATIVICAVILILSAASLGQMMSMEARFNENPVLAIHVLFVLFSSCISSYQIVISALLVWHVLKHIEGSFFFCSLWYVSHLSIITFNCFLFSAGTIISFNSRQCLAAVVTVICGIAYKGTFIYFSMVVNSYMHSLEI